MNDEQDFQTVVRFLQSFEPEVGGRMATVIDPDLDRDLRALAQGELNNAHQERLLNQIAKNPAAVRRLAQYLADSSAEPLSVRRA